MTDTPSDDEIRKWHRRFGIDANNRGWALAESTTRTPAETDEMLHVAHAAAWHWSKVGTPHNAALADVLLAQVHALVGEGIPALRHAQAAYGYFSGRESAPWELAFAHAVLAHAAHAAGDDVLHRDHFAKARELGQALPDAEDRAIFDATFRTIPGPA